MCLKYLALTKLAHSVSEMELDEFSQIHTYELENGILLLMKGKGRQKTWSRNIHE